MHEFYIWIMDYLALIELCRWTFLRQLFNKLQKEDIEQKIKDKPWKRENFQVPDWPRKTSVAVFRPTVQHDCLGNTSIVLVSEKIPSACYVAYKRTWAETTYNDALLYLEQQIVKDIVRPEQKCQLCYKLCDTPLTIVTKV